MASYTTTYNPSSAIGMGLGATGAGLATGTGALATVAGSNAWNPVGWVAMAVLAAMAAGNLGVGYGSAKATNDRNDSMYKSLIEQGFSPEVASGLVAQYGDTAASGLFDFGHYGDQSDWDSLNALIKSVDDAYAKYGNRPEHYTQDELDAIYNKATNEIESENNQILDLYNNNYTAIQDLISQNFNENTAAFRDYRDQTLTNNAMAQQQIAGSTRYEMDRQQRNAISRGASAAQRLVSNINTQLGLQAQSAQQSLNTSNALAQQLLNFRQAQAGLRQESVNNMTQLNNSKASLLNGLAERKANYGQGQVGWAQYQRQQQQQNYDDDLNNYFGGDGTKYSMFKSKYGSNAL